MLPPFPYQILLDWYSQNGRHDLPWRKDRSAYRVWLSEILLQQTQAPRVVPFFERIIKRYPTIEALSETTFEEFFPYYDGLWYYLRARNLLKTAQIVATKYRGIFPKEPSELRNLPGIGPYTTEAIRAFAFDTPTLAFDTNLEKIFSRFYFWDRNRKLTTWEKSDILAQFLGGNSSASTVNAALMDFASLVSFNAPSKIIWGTYPLKDCEFYKTLGSKEGGEKKGKSIFPLKDSRLVVILSNADGKILYSANWAEGKNGDLSVGAYSPFILPPTERNPRDEIKQYFRELGLSVSVRPPYSKGFLDGSPLVFFRARVQTGIPQFKKREKVHFAEWWEAYSMGKIMDFFTLPM